MTWKFAHSVGNRQLPKLILETREETLAYLANGFDMESFDKWAICSLYLCDYMDALEKEGFVYNAFALRRFEKDHGLEPGDENGSPLSILIYNCQGYRSARRKEIEGWETVTPELLAEALRTGSRLEVEGEGAFGTVRELLTVRPDANGAPRAFRPRQRRPLLLGDLPCRLVAPEKHFNRRKRKPQEPAQPNRLAAARRLVAAL